MQMKEFDELRKNNQKRLLRRVKMTCQTRWLSLEASVDIVYCEFT